MKKVLAIVLLLCLVCSSAHALTADEFVLYYTTWQEYTGCMPISMDTAKTGYTTPRSIYWQGDDETIVLIMQGEDIQGVTVACDRASRDFFGLCCSALVACAAEGMLYEDYGKFMTSYFHALTGVLNYGAYKDVTYQFSFKDNENVLNIFME